jgi:hypothetical protein
VDATRELRAALDKAVTDEMSAHLKDGYVSKQDYQKLQRLSIAAERACRILEEIKDAMARQQ